MFLWVNVLHCAADKNTFRLQLQNTSLFRGWCHMYILLDGEDRKQDTVFNGYTYSSSYWSKYLQEGLLGKSQINRKSLLSWCQSEAAQVWCSSWRQRVSIEQPSGRSLWVLGNVMSKTISTRNLKSFKQEIRVLLWNQFLSWFCVSDLSLPKYWAQKKL